jgi:hypothetical protein
VADTGWPVSLSKPNGWQNGGKIAKKGAKWRLLREHATLLFMTQLLYCHVVALVVVEKECRETNSHNHLFIKNLRRKHGFPNFQKSRKT